MQITQPTMLSFVTTIAEDPTILASLTAMHVHLVVSPFAPSLQLTLGDVTLASFPGSDPKNVGVGAQTVFLDPLTGLLNIQLLEPLGGWTWVSDDVVVTPETVTGFVVTDTANTSLIGSGLIDTPVTIDAEGQAVLIGLIRLQWSLQSPF
jgi:hypothetical protein